MHKERIGRTEFTFRNVGSSKSLLNKVYALRYQVYCKECNFIKESDYPDGIERDKYDPYSIHFVSEDENGVIGTARLILDNPYGFPLEVRCADSLTINIADYERSELGEISRLAISKVYRRRSGDGLYYTPDYHETKADAEQEGTKRMKPMAFGLYREIYQECKIRGIRYLFALMEKPLCLLLQMHNFTFEQVGPEIDFYGPVAPYICEIAKTEKLIKEKMPRLWEYIMDGLDVSVRPKI